MKTKIISIGILIVLSSCAGSILYRQPQPSGTKNMNKFPKEIRGEYWYLNDEDQRIFLGNVYAKSINWKGLADTIIGNLSDSLILRKCDTGYILNVPLKVKSGDYYWKAYLIHHFKDKSRTMISYIADHSDKEQNHKTIAQINRLTKVDTLKDDMHLIDPTPEHLNRLIREDFFYPFYLFEKTSKGYFLMDEEKAEREYEAFKERLIKD